MYQVYQITNKVNDRTYIGFHEGHIFEDDYYGSGNLIKQSVSLYGIQNFDREIIGTYEDRELALFVERLLVGEDVVKDDSFYNLVEGGNIPPSVKGTTQSKEHIRKRMNGFKSWLKLIDRSGKNNSFYGKSHSNKTKEILSEKAKIRMRNIDQTGIKNPNSKKVIHIDSGEVFDTLQEASEKFGITLSAISQHCKGKYKKQRFKYYD